VFVEDINLLRLAGLPFARVLSQSSPQERPLDQLSMERQLRLQGEKVRQALAEAATRRQLKWSLRIVRGQVPAELLAAAAGADLLALGKASWASTRRVLLGSTARTVVTQASGAVLLLQQGAVICAPIQVVYDSSPVAGNALATATRLGTMADGQLTVIIVADTTDTAQRLEAEATERLTGWSGQVSFHRLVNPTAEALAQSMRMTGGGTLVMSAQHPLLEGEGLQTVVGAIDCTALLVR
jgi:nucleotide-binding universal stress UspA family protein